MSSAWKISDRLLDPYTRPLAMAILNVTPDSFSDGGNFLTIDAALRQAEKLIAEGADIIDIGGESTRPGSVPVSIDDEMARTMPVIEAIANRFQTPLAIDTTKSAVAARAIDAGASIINDISGLRFDADVAGVAARSGAGLILMHSRGDFSGMHSQSVVDDIMAEVVVGLERSLGLAAANGVAEGQIVLDIGVGFGKTFEQNLELIAKLDKIKAKLKGFPMLVGASRKSFIGKLLGNAPPTERLAGSLAAAVVAVQNGANILRVHDVLETVQAIRVVTSIREMGQTL